MLKNLDDGRYVAIEGSENSADRKRKNETTFRGSHGLVYLEFLCCEILMSFDGFRCCELFSVVYIIFGFFLYINRKRFL